MNLGEKIRQLRHGKGLTQPELAEAVGIEQSYLSKLENGKYTPSPEVFDRVLEVFEIPVGDLVDDLDLAVRNKLRQIPVVAGHFDEQKRLLIGDRRRWMLVSIALLAVGITVAYAGHQNLFVPNIVYPYYSQCVTPTETGACGDVSGGFTVLETRDYRGERYIASVEGGFRDYYLGDQRQVDPWQNKVIAALGVLFAVLGVTGLALEKKLTSFQ